MALVPQRINIPIGGGLLQNETPEYLEPPALFECENMYHRQRTELVKRPGYNCNQICVDARKAGIDTWQASVDTPLLGVPIDRFLNTESGLTFASRGWLWSFVGTLFGSYTSEAIIPNSLKHCEIPDLQVITETAFGLAETSNAAGLQVIDAASCTHQSDLNCCTYLLHDVSGRYDWWVRLTCRSTGNLIVEQRILTTDAETFGHVCCAAYPNGFIVTCFNVTERRIMCSRYTLQDAQFTDQTFPALTLSSPESWVGAMPLPTWYELCGTTSNDVHVAWMVATGSFNPGPTGFTNGVFAGTIDASTLTFKYGGRYMGQNAQRTIGCLTYAPIFSVAGDENGNCAVAWIDMVSGDVGMRASLNGVAWASGVTLANVSTHGKQVGIGFVRPTKQVDVMWMVLYEFEEVSLTLGGGYLNVVHAQPVGANGDLIWGPRKYVGSRIISNPWCSMGNSYSIMATVQPIIGSGAFYADQPYVLARVWNDQDTYDSDWSYKNYQHPMATWGYGQVKIPAQPYRVLWDPQSSNTVKKVKGVGSIVVSDPFIKGVGVAVQGLEFDPRSPDRYSSAPLPGGGAVFGCANPWIFDGDRAFEATFVHRPWLVAAAAASGGTLIDDTAIANSSHYLQLVYEHQDSRGRITRSPASEIVPLATSGSGQKFVLRIMPPFWSARKPNTTVVKIYMCRDGVSFQLVGVAPVVVFPVIISPPSYISFEIGVEPALDAPFIYTFDGTVESGYAPFASHVKRWDNRIWIANQNQVSYSHEFIAGEGVSFPDSFTEYVDTKVTGLVPFDDRLVLFNLDAIAYRNGEGPRPNGEGSNYSKWNYFTHDVGCVNSRSLVRTQVGAFFQSRRHIEFLDTSCKITHQLAIETVFASVSDMSTGPVIIGGLSLPKNHQVRLLYCDQSDGALKQLVIDYETMTWSRWYGAYPWTPDPLVFFGDVGIDGDQVYIADGAGQLFLEVEYLNFDTNIPVSVATSATRRHVDWSVKTPWIKIDGLQGVQMVWNTMVMFRAADWTEPPMAMVPKFGITVNIDVDYQNQLELHGAKNIEDLKDLREPSGITYLQVGHINPICSAYQIQLSSSDQTDYDYYGSSVTGVYGIVGLWSELGVEPGTGRKRAESRM